MKNPFADKDVDMKSFIEPHLHRFWCWFLLYLGVWVGASITSWSYVHAPKCKVGILTFIALGSFTFGLCGRENVTTEKWELA